MDDTDEEDPTENAGEDRAPGEWQRLDRWLWCARVMKTRGDCAKLIAKGRLRINRQPTDKAHARVRPGDVLTYPWGTAERREVRVWRVVALATRRGPPVEARALYEDLSGT